MDSFGDHHQSALTQSAYFTKLCQTILKTRATPKHHPFLPSRRTLVWQYAQLQRVTTHNPSFISCSSHYNSTGIPPQQSLLSCQTQERVVVQRKCLDASIFKPLSKSGPACPPSRTDIQRVLQPGYAVIAGGAARVHGPHMLGQVSATCCFDAPSK